VDYTHLYARLVRQCERFSLIPRGWTSDKLEVTDFWLAQKELLMYPRGAGYCIWKPMIMLHACSESEEGDVVSYHDASVLFKEDPRPLLDAQTKAQDIYVIQTSFTNDDWTTDRCFKVMGCDSDKYRWARQLWAGTMAVRNTDRGRRFLLDWLCWLLNKEALLDNKDDKRDHPEDSGRPNFNDHRCDQSILTNLALKWGIQAQDNDVFCDDYHKDHDTNSNYVRYLP